MWCYRYPLNTPGFSNNMINFFEFRALCAEGRAKEQSSNYLLLGSFSLSLPYQVQRVAGASEYLGRIMNHIEKEEHIPDCSWYHAAPYTTNSDRLTVFGCSVAWNTVDLKKEKKKKHQKVISRNQKSLFYECVRECNQLSCVYIRGLEIRDGEVT